MPVLDKVMVTYRVKRGSEKKFEKLLQVHWPTLNRMKLVKGAPSIVFRGQRNRRTFYVEIFSWKSDEAVAHAHHLPEVMKVWEPMAALVEKSYGRTGMEFSSVCALDLKMKSAAKGKARGLKA
jgi:hypothetical protein